MLYLMARTPLLAFRLGMESRAHLVDMSKVYGSKNVSEFLRVMIEAVCEGDPVKSKAFDDAIKSKSGVQLQLALKEKEQRDLHGAALDRRNERRRVLANKKGGRRAKRTAKRT